MRDVQAPDMAPDQPVDADEHRRLEQRPGVAQIGHGVLALEVAEQQHLEHVPATPELRRASGDAAASRPSSLEVPPVVQAVQPARRPTDFHHGGGLPFVIRGPSTLQEGYCFRAPPLLPTPNVYDVCTPASEDDTCCSAFSPASSPSPRWRWRPCSCR